MQKKKRAISIFVFMVLCVSFSFPNQLWAETTDQDEVQENVEEPQQQEEERKDEAIEGEVSEQYTPLVQPTAQAINKQQVSMFAEDPVYTLNDLFGVGDFTYLQQEINEQLVVEETTDAWSLQDLATITSLNLQEATDFPSDLSVFTGLKWLTIDNANMALLSFQYKHVDSNLCTVTISNAPALTSIEQIDLDFDEATGGELLIQNTPALTNLSDITTSALYNFQLMAENVAEEVLASIEANRENMLTVSELDNMTIINTLKDNTTYTDAVGQMDYEPIRMQAINLGDHASITIFHSYIDTFSIPSDKAFVSLNLYNSVIREIADMDVQWDGTDNTNAAMKFTNLLVDHIGDLNAVSTNQHGLDFYLDNITATTVGDQYISMPRYAYRASFVAAETVGDFELNDGVALDDVTYTNLAIDLVNFAADSIGSIKTSTTSQNAYTNVAYYMVLLKEQGDISMKTTSDEDNVVSNMYTHQQLSMTHVNTNTLGAVSIVHENNGVLEQASLIDMFLYNTIFGEMQPIEIDGDTAFVYLVNTQVEQLKDLSIHSSTADVSIQNYDEQTIQSIGNVTLTKRELPLSKTADACYSNVMINLTAPLQSIGNISMDAYEAGESNLSIGDGINDVFKVDRIGNISANAIKELNLHNLGTRFLGELDLPAIETLDLSANKLARLLVKGNVFSSTLTSYDFSGNQIPGSHPVQDPSVSEDSHHLNFFDPTDEHVATQSYLYLLDGGQRHESGSVYTIQLDENEELSVDQLISLIRMYDNGYDDANERFFDHHVWKYTIMPTPLTRSLPTYSDETLFGDGAMIQGLVEGENYVELSLYDAVTASGKNENAKISFKVVKGKTAPATAGEEDDKLLSAGATMPNTGDSTTMLWTLLLGGAFLVSVLMLAKKMKYNRLEK